MSTAIWRGLYELLLSAVPDACVNMLHNEAADSANPIALELRPRARMVETLPVLPAKWTVIVSEVRPAVLRVTIVKMDREVLDQREFESSHTLEVAEYIKSHPFMSSRWSFCHGMRSFEFKLINRSAKCELLVAEGTTECRFCANGEVEKLEDSSFAPVKVEDQEQFVEVKLDMTNGDTKYYVSNQGLTTGEKIQHKLQEEPDNWTEDSGYGELQPSSFEVPAPSQLPINCWGNIKPPLTWFSLVALVLQYLPNHCGTLKDIFQKIEDNFPYYSDSKIDKGRNLYDVGTWQGKWGPLERRQSLVGCLNSLQPFLSLPISLCGNGV